MGTLSIRQAVCRSLEGGWVGEVNGGVIRRHSVQISSSGEYLVGANQTELERLRFQHEGDAMLADWLAHRKDPDALFFSPIVVDVAGKG